MSLDLYTRNIPLTQKARFWGNYVSSLKGEIDSSELKSMCKIYVGNADLLAGPEPHITNWFPSITETLPPTYPGLKQEFSKLETLMWRQRRGTTPATPVLPDANDR